MVKDQRHVKDTTLVSLQYIVLASVILYFGREIFIPLSFAALISFIIYPSCRWFEKRGFSRMSAILLNLGFLLIILGGVVALLVNQLVGFLQEWPGVKARLMESFDAIRIYLSDSYGFSFAQQDKFIAQMLDDSGRGSLDVIRRFISASAFSTVIMVLVPVYAVLILYYRHLWINVLMRIFPHERKESISEILSLTITAYHNFIKGMGIVYFVVGLLNSVGLLLLGVPHAILFGFIASVLTFIPYVGIMIGALLPVTMAWVTYDSAWYPVGVVCIFGFVQYLEANLIFPLAVSNRLNVNTLVMLIAIFAGGILWGMAGMILFVPFTGIVKLIADHNPKLKTFSLILGTGTVTPKT